MNEGRMLAGTYTLAPTSCLVYEALGVGVNGNIAARFAESCSSQHGLVRLVRQRNPTRDSILTFCRHRLALLQFSIDVHDHDCCYQHCRAGPVQYAGPVHLTRSLNVLIRVFVKYSCRIFSTNIARNVIFLLQTLLGVNLETLMKQARKENTLNLTYI